MDVYVCGCFAVREAQLLTIFLDFKYLLKDFFTVLKNLVTYFFVLLDFRKKVDC